MNQSPEQPIKQVYPVGTEVSFQTAIYHAGIVAITVNWGTLAKACAPEDTEVFITLAPSGNVLQVSRAGCYVRFHREEL